MGYLERDDIPCQFALAENFTICDNHHCSVLGPTWPNRLENLPRSFRGNARRNCVAFPRKRHLRPSRAAATRC